MFDVIEKIVRFIIITVIIASVIRVLLYVFGIDKNLDGKNETWDAYRKKEDAVVNFSGRVARRAGKKIKALSDELIEKEVACNDKG